MGGFIEGVVVMRVEGGVSVESHVFVGSKIEKINKDAEDKFREMAKTYGGKKVGENIESWLDDGYFPYYNDANQPGTVLITHADTARID